MPLDDLRHLVVLMLENRSFDNMLGFAYDRHTLPRIRIPNDHRIFFVSVSNSNSGSRWGVK
jgi:phospholipase C